LAKKKPKGRRAALKREKKRARRGRRRTTPSRNTRLDRSQRIVTSDQTAPASVHPSMQYNHPCTTAELIFGQPLTRLTIGVGSISAQPELTEGISALAGRKAPLLQP
jgi:hypothetical protein